MPDPRYLSCPALESLEALAGFGRSSLVRGTCLNVFELLEKGRADETINMLDVMMSLGLAGKIIWSMLPPGGSSFVLTAHSMRSISAGSHISSPPWRMGEKQPSRLPRARAKTSLPLAAFECARSIPELCNALEGRRSASPSTSSRAPWALGRTHGCSLLTLGKRDLQPCLGDCRGDHAEGTGCLRGIPSHDLEDFRKG